MSCSNIAFNVMGARLQTGSESLGMMLRSWTCVKVAPKGQKHFEGLLLTRLDSFFVVSNFLIFAVWRREWPLLVFGDPYHIQVVGQTKRRSRHRSMCYSETFFGLAVLRADGRLPQGSMPESTSLLQMHCHAHHRCRSRSTSAPGKPLTIVACSSFLTNDYQPQIGQVRAPSSSRFVSWSLTFLANLASMGPRR